MDLKKIIGGINKDILLKEATSKILPMEEDTPKKGWKVKAAGILAVIAAVAGSLSQFLGG